MSSDPMVRPDANLRMNSMLRSAPKTTEPAASPRSQAPGFTIHPPGVPSNPQEYNYEPQPDNSWKMYPPGTHAPPTAYQASMPAAASNADLMRMRQELGSVMSAKPGV